MLRSMSEISVVSGRQNDVARGVKAVLDLQQALVNGGIGPRVAAHEEQSNYCYAQLH